MLALQAQDFSTELRNFYNSSLENIFVNLKHPEIKPGAIIASPSKKDPDYFSHWTRDAGLVELALLEAYPSSTLDLQIQLRAQAEQWLNFEIEVQKTSLTAFAGLGEPRFYVDGTVVTFPWARPQDDGPALRALAAMKWAEIFIANGKEAWVREKLYNSGLSEESFIKRDLNYIAKRWPEPSYDIWEETNATHFFTRVVQLAALKQGTLFAKQMGDTEAANRYQLQAELIRKDLNVFLVQGRDYISGSINYVAGWDHKVTQLDTSVMIAANLGLFDEEFLVKNKSYFINAAQKLEEFFAKNYSINLNNPYLATAIGRFPEDVYSGTGNAGFASPWFITTHAMAEFYCKMGKLATYKNKREAAALKEKGTKYFERTLLHRELGTNMLSEQYSRNDGSLVGAKSLTWSYASYLTAYLACEP